MARTRQPTHLHSVKGTYQKHPERRPKGEPVPKAGIGKPPKNNPPVTWRRCWNEIVDQVCPGVLGDSDRVSLEIAARLLAEFRQYGEEMPAARLNVLVSLLARFGMTPSDRAKVNSGAQEGENDPAKQYF